METLVQSLLKITRLDAGSVTLEKGAENVADMLRDVELHFAYRAKQEHKELVLSGPEEVLLFCDRDWLTEAIDNIVKNALDHTESGDAVHITWKALPNAVQIAVKDNGCGIIRRTCTIFSSGSTAAAFPRTSRASGWACCWQRPSWKPIAARLRWTVNLEKARPSP